MDERTGITTWNILLGDDGSEHAFAAAKFICDLPLPPKSHVTALAVFPPTQINHYPALREQLELTCQQLRDRGVQVDSEIKTGDAAETILDFAERNKSNLIVLGALGLRATLGIFLGGVAQKIVEYGNCPVLIVRAPYEGLRHILIANDGSPAGWQALEFLTHFPLPPHVRISIIHVLPPWYPEDFVTAAWGMGSAPLPPIPARRPLESGEKSEEEIQGEELLEKSAQKFTSLGFKVQTSLKRGDAATEILQYAKEKQVDLIVAGSRGLSRVSAWLLGSVSRKIIHYAKCSVLVVRQKNQS
ncbi:MAG: universal stress protein [Anaerolineales bacterium]